MSYFSRPKTLQEMVAASAADTGADSREIEPISGKLRLGTVAHADMFPDYVTLEQQQGLLLLKESGLDKHLFILGATGAGKSETIKRLIFEILVATERDLFLVDGKGDVDLARDVGNLVYHLRNGQKTPVFKLGHSERGASYDAFRGGSEDIFNRLCALTGVSDAEGDSKYYANINRDLLQLICYAPVGPPRNFTQLRQRIDRGWLHDAWQHDPIESQDIDRIDARSLNDLATLIRPQARALGAIINDKGFALETVGSAIFSIRTQSVGDTAKLILDFLVEDLKDFMGKRQRRPGVLIIDEFGQFSNDNILSLLTLARSAHMGVVLATQDTASFKDETTEKMVLANTRTKILMATDHPEDVAELAGTVMRPEFGMQVDDGGFSGTGTVRQQHTFRVEPNDVARQRPGFAFVFSQRFAARVQIAAVGEVPPAPVASTQFDRPETAVVEERQDRSPVASPSAKEGRSADASTNKKQESPANEVKKVVDESLDDVDRPPDILD